MTVAFCAVAIAGAPAQSLFGPPSPFSAVLGEGPAFVVFPVDLNNDGDMDVVVGRGTMFFAETLGGPVPTPVDFFAAVELDAEILEIDFVGVVAGAKRFVVRTAAALHLVAVAPNAGGFVASQTLLASGVFGDGTRDGVLVADVSADGIPDVVTIRPSTSEVLVFPGLAAGSVGSTPTVSPAGPGLLTSFTLADLDGDGNPDFVGFSSPGGMYPLENTGGGMFAPFSQPAPPTGIGGDAHGGVAADFTGDGDLDMFVIGPGSTAHLWRGDGMGDFFDLPESFFTDSGGESVAAADFNGDGITDVAVALFTIDSVGLFLGNGAGLDPRIALRAGDGPVRVIPLDIDDDGDTDLMVTHSGFVVPAGPILFENGGADGGFLPESIIDRTIFTPRAMAVGDLDGDGLRDILVTPLGSGMFFMHNMGDGKLTQPIDLELPVSYPELRAIEAGDADPRNLIAYRNTSPSRIGWLRYDPDTQSLNFNQSAPLTGTLPLDLWSDDMNGDGLQDTLVNHASGAPAVSLFLQNETATFEPRILINGPANTHIMLTGDVDGANGSDLILVDNTAVHYSLRPSFGQWLTRLLPEFDAIIDAAIGELDGKPGLDGVFVGSGSQASGPRLLILPDIQSNESPIIIPLPDPPLAVATLDIDGDGHSDIVVTLDRTGIVDALAVLTSEAGVFDPAALTLHLTGSLPSALILADLHEPVQQRGAPARSLPEAIVLGTGTPSLGVGGVAINLNMTEVRTAPPAVCPGDTNGDNLVNFADLNAVLSAFGQSGPALPGDLNNDGIVNFADLNAVLSAFGSSCG